MEKLFNGYIISKDREMEVYSIIEGIIALDYDIYIKTWREGGLDFSRVFYDFGLLKTQGGDKVIDLWEQLSNGHRKQDREREQKNATSNKISEINKNKNDFCSRKRLNPANEKLVIIKEYAFADEKIMVIGLVDFDGGETVIGGTTAIMSKQTPNLYSEIKKTYKTIKDIL